MSNSIDRRVVSMQFDNDRFEKNAQTTMGTLERLKQSLRFAEGTKSFENVNAAARATDLSPIERALLTVSDRFSTFGIIGQRVIQNLTDKAMALGAQLIHSINAPIAQMKTGGMNRALNLEQAKFQLQGLGIAWEDVYGSIDKAVTGTRYGLDSAAKAASQLAASQVKLGDEMTTALTGISGVASMTNSEYDDIARIFTKIAGNNRVFGEDLQSISARGLNAASTLKDYFIEVEHQSGMTEEKIRDMVSKGDIHFKEFAAAMNWAFGEQATKANDTFTGALANTKAALSRIGAEFYIPGLEFMRKIFVELIPLINNVKKSILPLSRTFTIITESFADMGGIKEFFQTIKEGLNLVKEFGGKFTQSFEMFGEMPRLKKAQRQLGYYRQEVLKFKKATNEAGVALYDVNQIAIGMGIAEGFRNALGHVRTFIRNIKLQDELMGDMSWTFDGILRTMKIIGQSVGIVFHMFSPLFKVVSALFQTIMAAGSYFGMFVYRISETVGEMSVFWTTIEKIRNAVDSAASIIADKIYVVREALWDAGSALMEGDYFFSRLQTTFTMFTKILTPSQETLTNMRDTLHGVFAAVSLVWKGFSALINAVSPSRNTIADILELFSSLISTFFSVTGAIGRFLTKLDQLATKSDFFNKILSKLGSIGGTVLRQIVDWMTAIVDRVRDLVKGVDITSYFSDLTSKLKPLSGFGNLVSASFKLIGSGLGKVAEVITLFVNSSSFTKFLAFMSGGLIGFGSKSLAEKVQGIIEVVKKLFQKESPLAMLGSLKDEIKGLVHSITDTFSELQETLKAEQLKKIATAILILAGAMWIMSTIDPEDLVASALAMYTLFKMLTASLEKVSALKPVQFSKTVSVMVALAGAVLILAIALKIISRISLEDTIKGVAAVAALMKILSSSMTYDKKGLKQLKKAGGEMIAMAIAILILAKAVEKLGALDAESLIKGLIGVWAMVSMLSGFLEQSNMKDVKVGSGVALIAIAAGILILTQAVKQLGGMDTEALIKGLIGTLVVLLMLSGFLQSFKESDKLISAGVALIAISVGLLIMARAISSLGSMDWATLGKGLGSIFVSLLLLSGAVEAFSKNAGGAGALAAAAGSLILLAVALRILGTMSLEQIVVSLAGIAGVLFILGLAAKALQPFAADLLVIAGAVALLGVGMLAASAGLILFSVGVAALAGSIGALLVVAVGVGKAIALAITSFVKALAKAIPEIVTAVLTMMTATLTAIRDNIKQVAQLAIEIIAGFIEGLNEGLDELIVAAAEFVTTFIESLAGYLEENADRISDATVKLVLSILKILWESVKKLAAAAWEMIKAIKDKFEKKYPEAAKVIKNLPKKALEYLKQKFDDFRDWGKQVIARIKSGINQKVEDVYDFFTSLPSMLVEKLQEGWESFKEAGKHLINGFIAGITGNDKELKDAGAHAGKKVNEGLTTTEEEHSPSKVWMRYGKYLVEGLVIGMEGMSNALTKAGSNVAKITNNALFSAISAIDDENLQPTITPVVDMSNVYRSADQIGGIFATGIVPTTGINLTGNISDVRANSALMLDSNSSFAKAQKLMADAFEKFVDKGVIDPQLIYEAVRDGASMATVRMNLNDRELSRGLRGMGVVFK